MAVTSIYSNSDTTMKELTTEPGTDSSSDGSDSAIILHSGARSKSCSHPSKHNRRSSRLSKGTTNEHLDQLSVDSDPHIDVGDVLLHHEEKLLMKEERKADRQQIRDKQILAVALVKNVVKKEEDSSQPIQDGTEAEERNCESKMSMYTRKRRKIVKEEAEACQSNSSSSGSLQRSAVSPPASGSSNLSIDSALKKTTETVATRVSPRIRSRVAKSNTIGLKADYAMVRQTTMFKPKPSVPVPNPILTSTGPYKTSANNAPSQPSSRVKGKSKDAAPNVSGKSTSKRPSSDSATSKSPENSKKSDLPNAPTPTKSNETKSSDQVTLPARRRFFSIDLDRKFYVETLQLIIPVNFFLNGLACERSRWL